MKSMPWIVVVCVATLAGHAYIHSQSRTQLLQESLKLSEQARMIENDQVRDLFAALQEAKSRNETLAAQSFVAGVVQTLNQPDHYKEIWHAGYDRGTEVQKYADSTKPEDAKKESLTEDEATTQLGY